MALRTEGATSLGPGPIRRRGGGKNCDGICMSGSVGGRISASKNRLQTLNPRSIRSRFAFSPTLNPSDSSLRTSACFLRSILNRQILSRFLTHLRALMQTVRRQTTSSVSGSEFLPEAPFTNSSFLRRQGQQRFLQFYYAPKEAYRLDPGTVTPVSPSAAHVNPLKADTSLAIWLNRPSMVTKPL